MDAIFQLYEGLARLGPGSDESTRRALALLPSLLPNPVILDLGCGTGASSLVLARETGGRITAVDIHEPFLDELERRAAKAGLAGRITTRRQSIDALTDPPRSYDLIWSEGAIYQIGFERGLRLWRPLLSPGGCLCLTEATWLTPEPPAKAHAFWAEAYPAMAAAEENVERARAAGYDCLGYFPLPRSDWEREYYAPLEARMNGLRLDPVFEEIIAETDREIELYREHGDSYGYVFYAFKALNGV